MIARLIPRPIPRPYQFQSSEVTRLLNDPALAGLYLFEQSGNLEDVSGNGIHGTIVGASWAGNKLVFTNDNVNFGDNFDLPDRDTAMSVFMLLRSTASGLKYFWDKHTNDSRGWYLSRDGANVPKFIIEDLNGNTLSSSHSSAMVVDGSKWQTLCGIYDGSSLSSGITFYVDSNANAGSGTALDSATNNASNCILAQTNSGAVGHVGDIAFAAIWIGKELSQSEVNALDDFSRGLI